MFLTPDEVSRVRLRRRFRGYDRESVEHLLAEQAAGYAYAIHERDRLDGERVRLAARVHDLQVEFERARAGADSQAGARGSSSASLPVVPEGEETQLLFVWRPTGYDLRERKGTPLTRGVDVEVDGVRMTVTKIALSPLPDDRRRCAYLQAVG